MNRWPRTPFQKREIVSTGSGTHARFAFAAIDAGGAFARVTA